MKILQRHPSDSCSFTWDGVQKLNFMKYLVALMQAVPVLPLRNTTKAESSMCDILEMYFTFKKRKIPPQLYQDRGLVDSNHQ